MKCFSILFFLGLSFSVLAQLSPADETFIDSLMNRQYPSDLPGAVILVAKDGKPAFRKAYGMADMDLQVTNKPEYLFPLADLSKQFTAVCVLQLVQEGKISLKDNIKTWLPDYNDHKRTITVEHLLTHTSGIPGYDDNTDFSATKDYQREELLGLFMNDSLLFEPGTNFAYTNSGYYLLALIIEKVSGTTYNTFIDEHIFKRAGMIHTSIGTNDTPIPGLVRGYSAVPGSRISNGDYFRWSSLTGKGSIVSCVDDLLKWDESLYNNSLVSQELLQKAFTSSKTTNGKPCNFGYGWATGKYQHILFLSHRGNESGYATAGVRLPALHTSVYILSNNGSSAAGGISTKISLRLSKLHLPLPGTYKASPQDLKAARGTYSIDRIGLRIARSHCFVTGSNDSLFIQEPESEKILLLPVKKDNYMSSKRYGLYYRFARNHGDITGMDVYNLPVNIGKISERQKLNCSTPDDMKSATLTEDQLKKLCGKFDFGGDAFVTVTMKDTHLWVQFADQPLAEIFPETELIFVEKNTAVVYEFAPDTKGGVNKVIFHGMLDHVGIRVK
jgi:CubicO group peptidase (beta-lactamase class C family)